MVVQWKCMLADRLCLGFKLYNMDQSQVTVSEAGQV